MQQEKQTDYKYVTGQSRLIATCIEWVLSAMHIHHLTIVMRKTRKP